MTVHDARRLVLPAGFLGRGRWGALLIGLLGTIAASSPADDPPAGAVKPAFETGDISIGEPIALPFARPKSAPAAAGPTAAESAAPAAPGQGWLGIKVAESTVPGRWTVDEVAPRSPAQAAGINPGDEVRAIGGLPLRNADDVAQALTSIAPGQEVRLAIGRGEQVSDVTLTAGTRPPVAARALQTLPLADATPPEAPAVESPPSPAGAGTAPPLVEAPSVSIPAAEPPAAPPAAAAAPASTLPEAPPAAAFAAAPLAAPAAPASPAVVPAEPTRPRFPGASPSAELPAPAADRFEPAAIAAPPAPAQPAESTPAGRVALGVRTIPIDTGLQARFKLPAAAGAYVIGVVGDLPASRAGVPPGSVIVALDERPVRSPDELTRLVTGGPVGRPVPLEYVLPGGASRRAEVVLQALEQPLEDALVGSPSPTPASVPALQPQPAPTTARKPAATTEASALRNQIQRLEARLDAIEQRLSNR